jgi:hypothetical protein
VLPSFENHNISALGIYCARLKNSANMLQNRRHAIHLTNRTGSLKKFIARRSSALAISEPYAAEIRKGK